MFHPLTCAAEMSNKGADCLESGALVLAAQYFRLALQSTLENPPPPSHQNAGSSENHQQSPHNVSSNNSTERVFPHPGLLLERMAGSSGGVYADTFFITRAEDNSSDESGGFFCKDAELDYAIFSAIITFNTALAYHRLALEVRPRQKCDHKAKALYHMSLRLLSPAEDTQYYGIAGATCDLIIMASLNNLEKLDPSSNSNYTKHLVQLAVQRVDYGEDAISDFMAAWKGIFIFNSITTSSRSQLYAPAA
jgi:hypothetical protein